MANPWDADPIVEPAPTAQAAGAMPWESDPIVDEGPGLGIDVVGGTVGDAPSIEELNQLRSRRNPANNSDFARMISGRPGVTANARPSLFRLDSDFQERSGAGGLQMLGASARDMFGSRESAAKYLAEKVGGTLGKDDDGEPVVTLPDGTSYRVNDPGLDMTDVANVVGNAAAFFTPASWAARAAQARNVGLVGRMGLQGAAAGATDVGLQAAFNDKIDPLRTSASVVGGSAGEAVGTGLSLAARRGVSTFNEASGRNAARAADLLRRQNVEPTPEAVRGMAARIPELDAGADPNALIGAERYGLTYTQGQRATDPRQKFELLSREELLRQSPAGGQVLRDAAARNAERLEGALENITTQVGGRPGVTPAEMASGASARLQSQADALEQRISDAYQAAGQGARTAVSSESVASLPRILRTSIADFAPNPATTPVASRTLEQMQEAADALLVPRDGARTAGVTLKALETQRRILNNNINAATNNSDRAAMMKIKREFDSWMDEAVDTALVSGDAGALEAMKQARALRAEFGRRFEGRGDSDRFIAGLLDGTRTPEELVNIALGASQVSKSGGARFIERLRAASGDDPEVIGNLRAAHFLRLSRGNDGQPLPMGQLIRNIRTTDYNNASVVSALYTRPQWNEIRRLASSLEPLVARGDFARTSGTSERMARMLFSRVGGGLPIIGDMVRGVGEGINSVRAQRTLTQPLRLPGRSGPELPAVGAAAMSDGAR